MKLWEKCVLFGLFCAVLFSMLGFTAQCESIPDEVLRLHILANSDSEADQALKLRVRDRLLSENEHLMDGVATREEALSAVEEALPALREAAQGEVFAAGYSYPVQAELTWMYFPTRQYESVTLPAGRYEALRITIGEGEGHNWWCVIFPPLCAQAAGLSEQAVQALSDDDVRLVTESGGGYVVRFRLLELWDALVQRLS